MGNTTKTIVAATAAFALMLGTECNAPANISTPIKMIDTNAIAPGGGTFTGFDAPTFYAVAATWAGGGAGALQYSSTPDNYTVVASNTTPIPGGSGNFTGFNSPDLFLGRATGAAGQAGLYALNNSANIVKVADRSTPIPGGTGNFVNFGALGDGGQNGFFYADDGVSQRGIYGYTNFNYASLSMRVDTHGTFPLSSEPFTSFSNPSGPFFIGRSATQRGILQLGGPNAPSLVVSTSNFVPGGSAGEKFTDFSEVVNAGDDVIPIPAFIGIGSTHVGVYWKNLFNGSSTRKLADNFTAIPSGTGNFTGFADVNAFIGSLEGLPDATFIGFGAGGQKGIYADELSQFGQVGKVIAVGDTLDGKTVTDLSMTNEAMNGYSVYFLANFNDGSSGVFASEVPEPMILAPVMGLVVIGRRQARRERRG